jgi:hypothetical protein
MSRTTILGAAEKLAENTVAHEEAVPQNEERSESHSDEGNRSRKMEGMIRPMDSATVFSDYPRG